MKLDKVYENVIVLQNTKDAQFKINALKMESIKPYLKSCKNLLFIIFFSYIENSYCFELYKSFLYASDRLNQFSNNFH